MSNILAFNNCCITTFKLILGVSTINRWYTSLMMKVNQAFAERTFSCPLSQSFWLPVHRLTFNYPIQMFHMEITADVVSRQVSVSIDKVAPLEVGIKCDKILC